MKQNDAHIRKIAFQTVQPLLLGCPECGHDRIHNLYTDRPNP